MKIMPQTEIEKKRVAWCAEHFKFGMSTVEVFQLDGNAGVCALRRWQIVPPAAPSARHLCRHE